MYQKNGQVTFIDEAEFLKGVNERLYNNEYLGQMTGTGGTVFENIELREITDNEIDNFDYIYLMNLQLIK